MRLRIGVDLGGTKTEIVALDASGAELLRQRVPTPPNDYNAALRTIVELIERCEETLRDDRRLSAAATIGIGIPGAPSRVDGRIRNANSTCLNGRNVQRDLEALLERPIRLQNDANCFVMSEATDGAGAGQDVVFGVILGTGVGGGIVVHGALLTGVNAIAGEWGHNPLPPTGQPDPVDASECLDERPGPRCYCGRYGCIETWLSGPGMLADHLRHGGAARDAAAIVQAMRAGDLASRATFDRYVDRLARALAGVINVLDPDVIVLGGGLSQVDELYERVPERWSRYVFSDRIDTRLLRNLHGDASGVRGAACLWDHSGRGDPT